MIKIFEVNNIWFKKLLYERENMVVRHRGRYYEPNVQKEIDNRFNKIESIINKYKDIIK